jgi:outer membrane receptor protein involved in Fe transport
MFKKSKVCTGVLLALASLPAFSQATDRVEVTGSRIKSLSVDTVSPVTVIDAKEIRVDGVRNVESFLNNLPQVFADQGANVVNGSTGTATVNLRGLGADRTLVLVNGRRLPMGSPNNTAADLNQIPAGLIRRVEVLTGGASAVYGSDAVSGVVNFIMNDRFEGVQLDLNHSFFNHKQQNAQGVSDIVAGRATTNPREFKVPGDKSSDGKSTNFSLLLGSNFAGNRGNATVYFNYKKDDALLQSERDFSACSLASNAAGFVCGGSGTSATGRITNLNPAATAVGGKPNGGRVFTTADAAGNARLFSNATDQYNFGPLNYYQRPSERYGFNASANYEVAPAAKVYMEFGMHDDLTVAQIAPGGAFGSVHTVRFDNPLLSASWRAALDLVNPGDTTDIVLQRRNVEGGGRQSEFRNTSFRTVLGVKGDKGPWSYDAYLIEGKVIYSQNENNYFLSPRIDEAMDVTNTGGVATCASGAVGCVPYNPWALGGVTAAQLAYLQTPGFRKGTTNLSLQGASVAVDLGEYGAKLPWAKNGLGLSVGVERREERLALSTDPATEAGDLSGSGGPTKGLNGENTVKEIFGELRLPLIEKGFMADLLQATASARSSSYKSGTKADTYGLGLEWAPVREAKLRASFQRAVRAPNLVELYTAQGNNLYDNDNDPCAGAIDPATGNTQVVRNAAGVITDPGRSLAQCARTGVSAAQFGTIQDSPAGQYNFLQGGNPNLRPETANSVTVGLVLQPMRDLTVTLDYFDIKVKDTISNIDPTTTLAKCLDTGNPVYCGLISRDRLGTLWLLPQASIVGTNLNLGSTRTSGFDLAVSYNQKMGGLGSLGVSYAATLLKTLETEEIKGDGTYDCVGLYGANKCGSPNPEYRHKLRTTWSTPWDVEAALTWRHISKVTLQGASGQPLLAGTVREVERELAAQNYIDLAFSWNLMKKLTLSLGVNNLFDKDPPITSQLSTGTGNGNTYPSTYDALGRKVFLTASYKF